MDKNFYTFQTYN